MDKKLRATHQHIVDGFKYIKKKYAPANFQIEHGVELVQPFLMFHNKTKIACKPVGEEFDATKDYPSIETNSVYKVNKFMNLDMDKIYLAKMNMTEIEQLIQSKGIKPKSTLDGSAIPNRFEYTIAMTCGGCAGAVDRILGKLKDMDGFLAWYVPNWQQQKAYAWFDASQDTKAVEAEITRRLKSGQGKEVKFDKVEAVEIDAKAQKA